MTLEEILSKMKPEYREVVEAELAKSASSEEQDSLQDTLTKAEQSVADLTERLEKAEQERDDAIAKAAAKEAKKEDDDPKTTSFDETENLKKSLAPEALAYIERLEVQKSAAEDELKKAKAVEKHAEAIAKAEELKAIPLEKEALIDFIEKADTTTVDMLSTISKAIETTVLSEVGKSYDGGASFEVTSNEAWSKIEKKAQELATSQNITKEKAIGAVIEAEPALYKEYLEGGAN